MEVTELVHRVHADFAAELRALQTQHEGDALPTGPERCFAPLEARGHHLPGNGRAPTVLSPSPSLSPRSLRALLRLVFRRYAGKLIVRGRLLNHEELLVKRFLRLSAGGEASDDFSLEIQDDAVRFVVDCKQAKTAQVGKDDVVARLLDTPRVSPHQSEDDDTMHASALPVVSCDACEQYETAKAWSNPRILEQVDELYGFSLHTAIAGITDEEDVNAVLRCHRSATDIGSTRAMMRAFNIPVTSGFQSFALPKLTAALLQGGDVSSSSNNKHSSAETNPWSYQMLDAAQKRKWARERFELADELAAKGRLKDAIAEFANCLKLDEKHLKALAAKGRAHARLRQLPEAIEAFEAVLAQDRTFPGVKQELLRVRGKLEHSRHVVGGESLVRTAPETEIHREAGVASHSAQGDPVDGVCEAVGRVSSRSAASTNTSLEKDRLRRLLEDEERRKRDKRRKKRARDSDSDSDASSNEDEEDSRVSRKKHSKRSSSSSTKKTRDKKSSREKSRKTHKKSSSSKKHKKRGKSKGSRKHRRRHDSDSDSSSSGYSSEGSSHYSTSSQTKHKEDRRKGDRDDEQQELPAILARPQHRIWK